MEISERLYHQYYNLLFSIAYRMTSSVSDAEDMVQDVLLQSINRVDWKAITNPKAYLCKLITNRCLDYLKSARNQRTSYIGEWLPEPLITEISNPPEEQAISSEQLGVAYLLLLEQLIPTERLVFVFREVFQYRYREISELTELSESNCRKLYSRAKQKLAIGLERKDYPPTGMQENQILMNKFIRAIQSGERDTLSSLLSQEVVVYADGGGKVSAAMRPIFKMERVIAYLLGIERKAKGEYTYQITTVNGGPGIVFFVNEKAYCVCTCELTGDLISKLFFILNPDKLRHVQ
ncbi:RNA polymerase sigma factor SigJ [Mechercharimyces sp. CAU 1602]|uniref:RNA polymerase sigma factor SigJ n=1 Tax=Mechercharimyces sp. CAU 1602 TaxID=2973933 RepID=UPI00216189F4|nr:RNA polymerase sigma factor SigJ [Mechercharimyces sp. CAU 1602]MCS1350937.1 RNA polymerase sigma factor SigJ [Mechercharimyces sp. CAU 1602]